MVAGIRQIFRRNEYAAFLKLPEAQFSSAPTVVFLNLLTVEKPGNIVLPSIKGKVFNLSVSGNVIYAIPREKGC